MFKSHFVTGHLSMKLSISAAARRAGVDRQILYRKMEKGELSKEVGADGKPVIDLAELVRIYPSAVHEPAKTTKTALSRDNSAILHDLVTALKHDKARLEVEVSQARAALKEAGEREREERLRLVGLLEKLQHQITDQREKERETTAELPPRRRWFGWR